ncbi:hypothetical protein ACFWHQ_37495 [Streptomyces sp. NPDC060334]
MDAIAGRVHPMRAHRRTAPHIVVRDIVLPHRTAPECGSAGRRSPYHTPP